MAKKTQVEYNNFTLGFVTQASPLTFPENASLDEVNVNINKDGTRQRRFGLSWFTTAVELSTASNLAASGNATSAYSWFSAGNNGNQNLGVLQNGRTLYFFDLDNIDPPSALLATKTLTSTEAPSLTFPYEYTTAYGKLIIAAGGAAPVVFDWNGTVLTKSSIPLKMRDRFGIFESSATDLRTGTISQSHYYNLRNQGWVFTLLCAGNELGSVAPVTADPIAYTFLKNAYYPSNADLIWASKLGAVSGTVTDNIDTFSPWDLNKQIFGSTPAPRGKYILDLFTRSNSRFIESGSIYTIPTDTSTGYVSSVSSFAGRMWYSIKETSVSGGDNNSPKLANMIFYSKALSSVDTFGNCYSENDPTAEGFNDVLDTDGGFITIPEIGEIYKLAPLGESLYVISSNGVWEVYGGGTGGGFSATNQSVLKVTSLGTLSSTSVIIGDNALVYWSESGIYSITIDPTTLRGISTNLTEDTIQGFYDEIPLSFKKFARGNYDPISRQAVWLYNDTQKGSNFYYDKELILDLLKIAFTKREINPLDKSLGWGPYPTAHLRSKKLVQGSVLEAVTDGAVTVTDGGVIVTSVVSDAEQQTKTGLFYWSAENIGSSEKFRIGSYLDFDFRDWKLVADSLGVFGADAEAFLLTGYLTGGIASNKKYLPYVSVFSKRTESGWSQDLAGTVSVNDESSCNLQVQWEWTNNAHAGLWSSAQEVYRLPRLVVIDPSHLFSYDVITTRNKIKGGGRALSLKFSSSPGKNMYLLGWGLDVEVKEKV